MRLTLRTVAALLIGVFTLGIPSVEASPVPLGKGERRNSNINHEHESSVSKAFHNIASFVAPGIHLVETFPALEPAKRRVITDQEGFGSAPSTEWGDAAKQGMKDKPKTGMGGKSKKKTWGKPKQGMGTKPKTEMGNRPRGFCATCLAPDDTSPPADEELDRLSEPNGDTNLEGGLTEEEKERVMSGNGRSWVKRQPPAERALTQEEEDRVMEDDGRSWVRRQAEAATRRLTKEEADRVMVDDERSWVKRELPTARALTKKKEENRVTDDEGRSWSKREPGAAEDASQTIARAGDLRSDTRVGLSASVARSSTQKRGFASNQIPAFDAAGDFQDVPYDASDREIAKGPILENGPAPDARIMESDGARWTRRVDKRVTCAACDRDLKVQARSQPDRSNPSLKDIDWQKRRTEDREPSFNNGHEWSRRSSVAQHDVEADMERANVDFDWSKRQGSSFDDPDPPSHRMTHADGLIMVDRRNGPENLQQDTSKRVNGEETSAHFSSKARREESDILWEFIPKGQSRIGRA